MDKKLIKKVLREGLNIPKKRIQSYLSGISDTLIDKDWDELYEEAQQYKNKWVIQEILKLIFKDKDVMVRVADNYYWSDGSNGFINFSNLDHYITDIGYRSFADNPELFKNIDELKKHILYSYASSGDGNLKAGLKYKNYKYNPDNEFTW